MDTKRRFALFAAMALTFAAAARADDDEGWGDSDDPQRNVGIACFFALQTDLVQNDLKLTAEQSRQLKGLKASFENVYRDVGRQHIKLSPQDRGTDTRKLYGQIQDAATRHVFPALEKILTAKQLNRLKQIMRQSEGIAAFWSPEMVQELELSQAQQESVQDIFQQSAKVSAFAPIEPVGGLLLTSSERETITNKHADTYWAAQNRAVDQAAKMLNSTQRRQLERLFGSRIDRRKLAEQQDKLSIEAVVYRPVSAEKTEWMTLWLSAKNENFSVGSVITNARPEPALLLDEPNATTPAPEQNANP
ncbi:MAG: hypothetical protein WD648_08845 [Planctomycetaceae bacterium]